MHLSSKIISENSVQFKKDLKCYFDHPFQLIYDHNNLSQLELSLANHTIIPYIFAAHEKSNQNMCIIIYKYTFNIHELLEIIQANSYLEITITEYNHKTKIIKEKDIKIDNNLKFGQQSTIILEIKSNQKKSKIYLLPFTCGEEQTLISRAIHQNFKILKVIKQFVTLQGNWKGNLQFQQPIFKHLSSFLYEQRVRKMQIILWIQKSQFDNKLLQKVGQLKLPQPWLQKEEYRIKKQEMYKIKSEQYQLHTQFRSQKEQFCNTINFLQRLSGKKQQSYQNINIQTLKTLKQEGFSEKVQQIKQLENHLAKLELRSAALSQKMNECKIKMMETQKKHVLQILSLKKQIGAIQHVKKEGLESCGLIFNRSRKSTDIRVVKTIFTNMDKQAKRINETDSKFNRISDNSENRTQKQLKLVKGNNKKQQFKNNEKKIASVVKDTINGVKIDKNQLRQDYESQIMKIDFQMQKKYAQMLSRYELATKIIKRAIDQNQQINI